MNFGQGTPKVRVLVSGLVVLGLLYGGANPVGAAEGCNGSEEMADAPTDTVYDPSDDVHLR